MLVVRIKVPLEGGFMLSKNALQEFKIVWKEEFGEDLPDNLALEEGVNLLTLLDQIYRPVKKEWMDEKDKSDFPDLPAP
ncbi:MAG: hypothetical protein A2915_00770 [Candidatus Yanofskybacteria bacterium RIFCSPLOWO2_01_FULL_41_34]|uniref:Uncharacterized protein n=1 Tax=Candidatus Yanofskybacteria bacterium RIFCSPHIGHO2_01_FULL_41_26 TaxID=1802661 RepID=A0A1F8ECJ1_9BACT|nr:MAG: hypothetical protein A2649_02800 [Candidatus Yanofskybacteria bacterium RIFCSPHIGHO2_01_FULL_41_26]OGN22428.1 MAG: hypothetical protein A2915_00770 [Candidatus Yanofskybacteria bacterium RIFCSPLOWO2_01_FULL_41_34]